jgi:hypothetical protein
VVHDVVPDFFAAFLAGGLAIFSIGIFGIAGAAGAAIGQALLISATVFLTGALVIGADLKLGSGPPPVPIAGSGIAATPPMFRNLMKAIVRRHDTLEDALQTVKDPPGKLLVLAGPIYVTRLANTTPFHYVGRGIVYSDDPEAPVLTGPIVPFDFDTNPNPSESHLTIVHWRGADPSEVEKGVRAVAAETVMTSPEVKQRLARTVLDLISRR